MFTAVAVLREFRKRHDLLKASYRKQITPRIACSYVNASLDRYVRHRAPTAKSDPSVRSNLFNQEVIDALCPRDGQYASSPMFKLPPKMFYPTGNRALVSKEGCPALWLPVHIVSLSEYDMLTRNHYFKTDPGFEWVLGARTARQIIIDAPNGVSVESVKADGYREPRECHAPSLSSDGSPYVDDEGTTVSVDQPLEIEGRDAFSIIIGAAVAMTALDAGDPEAKARIDQLFALSTL